MSGDSLQSVIGERHGEPLRDIAALVHQAALAVVESVQPRPVPVPVPPTPAISSVNVDAVASPTAAITSPPAPTPAPIPVASIAASSKTRVPAAWSWIKRYWTPEIRSDVQRLGQYAVYGFAAWFAVVGVLIITYRFVNPPASNLMLYNYLTGKEVHHTWVPLKKISPHVIKAVVVAEDAQFCRHWGIDFGAIKEAIENAHGGTPRGASTISMQTAKNMFLWQSKSYVRKILEVPVTIAMELIWPKRRMLEIYLNIAEWGPGVFGIGAAARHHFKTTPANLGRAAAAQLAAALPNPKVRRAGKPGPRTRRKANVIRGRARHARYYTGCVLG